MVLVQTIDVAGQTGRIDASAAFQPLYYNDLADGINRFFTGSTFSVIERITIRTAIYDPKLVDTDNQYFTPKYYLGNYQTIGSVGLPLHRLGDDGFLIDLFQTIEKITYYTVGNPLNTLGQKGDRLAIEPCNFFLKPSAKVILPVPEPVLGFELQYDGTAFTGQITNSPKQLDNFFIQQYFTGIGLFLFPGVQAEELIYSAQIAGLAPLADDIPSINTCALGEVNCRQQFNLFLSKNQGDVFLTIADARVAYPQQPPTYDFIQETFVCPTNPLETFTYVRAKLLAVTCDIRRNEYFAQSATPGSGVHKTLSDSNAAIAAFETTYPHTAYQYITNIIPVPVPGCPPGTSANIYVAQWTHDTTSPLPSPTSGSSGRID